jgi:hypothetical protein
VVAARCASCANSFWTHKASLTPRSGDISRETAHELDLPRRSHCDACGTDLLAGASRAGTGRPAGAARPGYARFRDRQPEGDEDEPRRSCRVHPGGHAHGSFSGLGHHRSGTAAARSVARRRAAGARERRPRHGIRRRQGAAPSGRRRHRARQGAGARRVTCRDELPGGDPGRGDCTHARACRHHAGRFATRRRGDGIRQQGPLPAKTP